MAMGVKPFKADALPWRKRAIDVFNPDWRDQRQDFDGGFGR